MITKDLSILKSYILNLMISLKKLSKKIINDVTSSKKLYRKD